MFSATQSPNINQLKRFKTLNSWLYVFMVSTVTAVYISQSPIREAADGEVAATHNAMVYSVT